MTGNSGIAGTDDGIGEMVVDIVSAFVSNNAVPRAELPGLIGSVHATLQRLLQAPAALPLPAAEQQPAVPIKKSVSDEFLICLEDGKKFRSLKRHLTILGLTPHQYREKWKLPADYPMVAPAYAAKRSEFAQRMGLGRKEPVKAAGSGRRRKAATAA